MLKPLLAQVLVSTRSSLQAGWPDRETRAGALAGIFVQCRVSICPERS